MTGWELDGPALDAQGEQANTGQPVWCRVRACGEVATHGDHCEDHDTPEVRVMGRQPWDELPAAAAPATEARSLRAVLFEQASDARRRAREASASGDGASLVYWQRVARACQKPLAAVPAPGVAAFAAAAASPLATAEPQVDNFVQSPVAAPRPTARPCWAWCGRRGPGPHCHPASRYGHAPTFPCLACGRELHRCETVGLCCPGSCTEFWLAVIDEDQVPSAVAEYWLGRGTDEHEAWEERAAILQDSGYSREIADRRALLIVWRSFRDPAPAEAAPPAITAEPTQDRPPPAAAPAVQLALFALQVPQWLA